MDLEAGLLLTDPFLCILALVLSERLMPLSLVALELAVLACDLVPVNLGSSELSGPLLLSRRMSESVRDRPFSLVDDDRDCSR